MLCEIPVLGRCLFCLPLRIGVLAFGYLNVVFSAFMVGIYSFSIHSKLGIALVFHGVVAEVDDKLCLFMFCVDVVFGLVWVYGAHRITSRRSRRRQKIDRLRYLIPFPNETIKILIYLKVYYYYAIATTLLIVLLQILTISTTSHFLYIALEMSALFFAGLCLHIYLIILTRSLIRKLELSDQHTYENQLHTIINGEIKADGNGVYPATVVPNETV